jgi:hypothetical protein
VSGRQVAATATGQALQADALAKETKKAFGALLAVAILQVLFAVLILVLLQSGGGRTPLTGNMDLAETPILGLAIVMFGIAAIFFGLAFWARRNPLPAAIVGLVVFVTVHLLDALADPTAIVRGILVKIVVIVVLIRAISAGARHRAMLRSMTPATP